MSHSELSSSESDASSTPGSSSEDEDEYGVSDFPAQEDKSAEAGEVGGQSGGGIGFADALQKILKKTKGFEFFFQKNRHFQKYLSFQWKI